MKKFLHSASTVLLILLYSYAAMSKLVTFDDFRGELYNQNIPHEAAAMLVYIIPITELLAVVLLIFPGTEVKGLWLSLSLLSIFTGYIGLVILNFWSRVPCSCGGILSHMGWHTHLIFNLFFLCLNLIAIYNCCTAPNQKGVAENLRKE